MTDHDPRPVLKRAAELLEVRSNGLSDASGEKWDYIWERRGRSFSEESMDVPRWVAMMRPEIGYWLAKILRDEISIVGVALSLPGFQPDSLPLTPATEIAKLIVEREGKCPTCQVPPRETVGMVCQACGRNYGEE